MYHEPPRYEDIDWVALAGMMGIRLRMPNTPTVLNLMSEAEKLALIEHYSSSATEMTQITDELDILIFEGRATSLDKACIKVMVNRNRWIDI